jgi:hypothetical protein
MSLGANRIRLATTTKQLSVDWAQTKEVWRDAKSQEFERKFLEELFDGVETAGGIMEQLDKILNKIRTDCE